MNILKIFKDLLIESLKDNKKLIIVLYISFIVIFIISWILSAERMTTIAQNVTPNTTPNMNNMVDPLELFINNELSGIMVYFDSIIFGIAAIVSLVYNAFNIGALGSLFAAVMPKGGILYITYIIPHGIFEITATVLQSAAGILLFSFIWKFIKNWRKSNLKESFENNKKILIQSIMLMIFSTILLLIAAPIESYLSIPFSNFICGV